VNIEKLEAIKDEAEKKARKIGRLLADRETLTRAIEDLKYLKHHAGEMIFTGNSGKIGELDVMLKTVKINTLGGCVAVPALLIELAEKRLVEIGKEAEEVTT
jgi:hypothetical protein